MACRRMYERRVHLFRVFRLIKNELATGERSHLGVDDGAHGIINYYLRLRHRTITRHYGSCKSCALHRCRFTDHEQHTGEVAFTGHVFLGCCEMWAARSTRCTQDAKKLRLESASEGIYCVVTFDYIILYYRNVHLHLVSLRSMTQSELKGLHIYRFNWRNYYESDLPQLVTSTYRN